MENADQSFRIEDTIQGCRFVLPPRILGDIRYFALIGVVVGGFGCVFMFLFMKMPLREGFLQIRQGQNFGWLLVGFGLLGLSGLVPAVLTLLGSIAVLTERTYCIIEIQEDRLLCTERFGPLRWRRKKRVSEIQRLAIEMVNSDPGRRKRYAPNGSDLSVIVAQGTRKNFWLGIAYSRRTLEELAIAIAQQLDVQLAKLVSDSHFLSPMNDSGTRSSHLVDRVAVDISDSTNPVIRQPSDSTIVRHEIDGSTVYQVPSAGLWQGSKGLFAFSLLWNGFMTVFTTVLVSGAQNMQGDVWIMALVLILFWCVGIGLLLAAINVGRRTAMICLVGEELFFRTKSLFGEKNKRFFLHEISAIEVGPSGMEMNDVPICELQVMHHEGKSGFLSYRSDDELDWLAYELREQLKLNNGADDPNWQRLDAEGQLIEPGPGKVQMHEHPSGKRLVVPPLGWTRQLGLLILGFILVCLGIWLMVLSLMGPNWIGNPFGQAIDFPNEIIGGFLLTLGGLMFGFGQLLASRCFEISVTQNELRIERFGFLSRQSKVWHADNILEVDRQQSGAAVNNVPLEQLVIAVDSGIGLQLMTGRPATEIDFVAFHIHSVLQSPALAEDRASY